MSGLRNKLVGSPIGLVCFRCGVRLTILHFCAVCHVPLCGRCLCCEQRGVPGQGGGNGQ